MDSENIKHDSTYPKSVLFILSNEFCERFCYYGLRAILALYLSSALHYSQNDATVIYHLFSMLCYFFPLFGAIMADSFWGKFKTIIYLSIVYALGNIVLSFAAIAIPTVPYKEISLLGLSMIALGTGGIKPCVSAFGGDQFVLPQQALQLQRFFSIFYFSINAGAMLSTFLTPVLRSNVKCFHQNTCYPLAFAVPAALMVFALAVFIFGKRFYKIRKPTENVIAMFIKCIKHALKNKFLRSKTIPKKNHWLEYASDKYKQRQISDVRAVLAVLYIFIPVPMYWALADQQGSGWIFQATKLNGRFFGYEIKPDQMHVLNPLLVLILIPIFEYYIYPALAAIGIKRPLQKMTIGGILIIFSFFISAFLEFNIEKSNPILPSESEGQFRICNNVNCNLFLDPPIQNIDQLEPLSVLSFHSIAVSGLKTFKTVLRPSKSCTMKAVTTEFAVYEKQTKSYFIGIKEQSKNELAIYNANEFDDLEKNLYGQAKIRFVYNSASLKQITLYFEGVETNKFVVVSNKPTKYHFLDPGIYKIIVDENVILENVEINHGEIDTLVLYEDKNMTGRIINEVPPNKIHILWQIPQITIVSVAEIMFSITGLEFSFTQAPTSMKSVVSAAWLLTTAFGNLLVAVISKIVVFKSQVYQFLLFAGLMIIDVVLLIFLSIKYQYVNTSS